MMLGIAIASALAVFVNVPVAPISKVAATTSVDTPLRTTKRSAVVTTKGLLSSGGGPAIPTDLLMRSLSSHSVSLSWTAPSPGRYPISHYVVYRNGTAYTRVRGTRFTDHRATNAAAPSFAHSATVYSYAVSAVDTHGQEGPRAQQSVYLYRRGVATQGEVDYSYGIRENWRDTRGSPTLGRYDVSLIYPAAGGGFQPYSALPLAPVYDLEIGSFKYFTVDVKVTNVSHPLFVSHISRLPPGDVYPRAWVYLYSYCTPVVERWVTCKIPLSALSIGFTNFTASISGKQLTVTGIQSGVGVDAGGFIAGPGIPAGTYIVGTPDGITYNNQQPPGNGLGRYTIAGPGISGATNVTSEPMIEQRTSLYKIDIGSTTQDSGATIYLDNIGWTTD